MSSLNNKLVEKEQEQEQEQDQSPEIMLPHHLDNVPPPRLLYECFLCQHIALQKWLSLFIDDAMFSDLYKISQLVRKKTTLGEDQTTGLFEMSEIYVIFSY